MAHASRSSSPVVPVFGSAPAKRRGARRRSPADEYYLPKQIDNSRLVRSADPRERREQARLVAVSLVLAFAVLATAYQRFSLIRAGYKMEALKIEREQLQEANRTLRLEEAALRDPQRVDALARNLGLGLPAAGQVVHLQDGATEPEQAVMARAGTPRFSPPLKMPLPAAAVTAAIPTSAP